MEKKINVTVTALKALADKRRLRIVNLLSCGELCVCELTENLGISQPNMSHHLKVLKNAELIIANKRGKWIYYMLNRDKLFQLRDNFDFIITKNPNKCDIKRNTCEEC
jgi:ArsR family transcriptional regulator